MELLSETGLRIGEALALEWADVDLGARRIHVRRRLYRGAIGAPKSRYGHRRLPLTPRVAQMLWRRQATARGPIAFSTRTGGYHSPASLWRWWTPAARQAGVEWAGFHTLRHTCATRLFRSGWNAKQVQLMLGHHSPAFTMSVYVHTLADELPEPVFGHTLVTDHAKTARNTDAEQMPETAQPRRIAR